MIKATTFWAKQYLKKWPLPTSEGEAKAIECAYLAGLEKMREMTQGMMLDFGGTTHLGLATLIGGIGKAQVDPDTGKREEDM